jgi:hypothetical protein
MKTNIHLWSYLAQFFLEWKVFQAKGVEKHETHFMFNNFFFSENRTVYEIMWKNFVERGRPQMTNEADACEIPKDTNTHTQNM